jgi:hypothetical protein
MDAPRDDHWLARRGTIRFLWIVFGAILVALVLADLAIEHHPLFGLDASLGFGAWYGFAACVLLVVFAKALGAVLRRPDTYYDD